MQKLLGNTRFVSFEQLIFRKGRKISIDLSAQYFSCWTRELKEDDKDTLDLVDGERIIWPGSCDNEVYRTLQIRAGSERLFL